MNLRSSIQRYGQKVTQILHFKDGTEATINHIHTDTFKVGRMTKFDTDDRGISVNHNNINYIETFPEE